MPVTEKELDALIEVKADIEKVTKISSDGERLLTRIPKDIVDELQLDKTKKIRWLVNPKDKEIKLTIEE